MLHTKTRMIWALVAAIAIVALAGCGGGDSSSSSAPAGAEASEEAVTKTVLVFAKEPSPSTSPTSLHAGLEKGKLPAGEVEATVLTDEDCAPDQHGISHCRNVVSLPSGRTVVLRHPHEMHEVPCLEPGETVLLRRA